MQRDGGDKHEFVVAVLVPDICQLLRARIQEAVHDVERYRRTRDDAERRVDVTRCSTYRQQR